MPAPSSTSRLPTVGGPRDFASPGGVDIHFFSDPLLRDLGLDMDGGASKFGRVVGEDDVLDGVPRSPMAGSVEGSEQGSEGSEQGGSEQGESEQGGSEQGGSEQAGGSGEQGGSEYGGSEQGGSDQGGSDEQGCSEEDRSVFDLDDGVSEPGLVSVENRFSVFRTAVLAGAEEPPPAELGAAGEVPLPVAVERPAQKTERTEAEKSEAEKSETSRPENEQAFSSDDAAAGVHAVSSDCSSVAVAHRSAPTQSDVERTAAGVPSVKDALSVIDAALERYALRTICPSLKL